MRVEYRFAMKQLLFLAVVLGISNAVIPGDHFEVLSSKRNVDLASHLVKISTTLEIKNSGAKATNEFFFTVEENIAENLSFISASGNKDSEDAFNVLKQKPEGNKESYKILLDKKLEPQATRMLYVYQVFRNLQQPFPKETKQSEPQLMWLSMNQHLYSPYKIISDSVSFKTPTSKIISYSKIDPYSVSNNVIEYGPYANVAPFTKKEISVHFENHSPFLTVTSLNRWIEVSHWGGNIAIEESIAIKHSGAKLLGSFSRFDYMYLRSQEGISSVKSYKTVLPAGAKDVYYRDEIGNISTSNLLQLMDAVELEIRPRYPLFGGWVTQYMLGYNLPSYQYLFTSGSDYKLKMRFVDHIFDDMSVDDATVKVILPEGASDIKLNVPYDVEREKDELHFTFLDFSGRPVVTMKKKNLVEEHIQDFELSYKFNPILLLREPLMLIVGLLVMFLSVILLVRLDFSISIDSNAETRMKVAGIIEQLLAIQGKRESLYAKFQDAITAYRKSKDNSALQAAKKSFENDSRDVKTSFDQILKSVKDENPEAAEKIVEIQRLENVYAGFMADAMKNATQIVAGNITAEAFKKAEESLETKKSETRGKVNKVVAQL